MESVFKRIFKGFVLFAASAILACPAGAEAKKFGRDFSPAEGILTPSEKSARMEMCLNGYWNFQPFDLPKDFVQGSGNPCELPQPEPNKWESVKIKIPSPWNVNNWGGGQETGEGTRKEFAPSSVYFPSYPKEWAHKRMGWLKKSFELPKSWGGKRVFLHFDAVAGWTDVFINGRLAASHFDQHLGFEADITDFLKEGKNEILLGIRHSKLFDKKHPTYRMNATYPAGSNTDDLIGVWQDVFLIAKNGVHISDVFAKPLVSEGMLEFEVEIKNDTKSDAEFELKGSVSKWINLNAPALEKLAALNLDDGKPLGKRAKLVLDAAEPRWTLAETPALTLAPQKVSIKSGETKTVKISSKDVSGLEFWTPDTPNLYMANFSLVGAGQKTLADVKSARFGWREFKIEGDSITLNGKKIRAFGDLQHPFGPYICSRRFAFAWYEMIKLFGGNAVRPHAQPWPKYYYDVADETGVMVLAEDALFGSSIRPNLTEEITWQRTADQIKRLVKRYRNNPSVLGWSVGNEMFAMSLPHLNKVPPEEKAEWDKKLVALSKIPLSLDPTRPFVTIDGDQDMNGELPVWSRHFGDGDISGAIDSAVKNLKEPKPLVVGEFGATYYGNPLRVYKYLGDSVFYSYAARNEALAGDLYRMATTTAKRLAYFSPSEICWFGIEHLPYGYSDFSRLPNLGDGVFPNKPYEEGKPGYQFERIPPYIFTINPAIDPSLPFMRPLAHYKAIKSALKGGEKFEVVSAEPKNPQAFKNPKPKELPAAKFAEAGFVGDFNGTLAAALRKKGVSLSKDLKSSKFIIADGENLTESQSAELAAKIKTLSNRKDSVVLIMIADKDFSPSVKENVLKNAESVKLEGTILKAKNGYENFFHPVDLYFSERASAEHFGDRKIFRRALNLKPIKGAEAKLEAANIDWSLFDAAEKEKCAQTLLYEQLEKPFKTVLATVKNGKGIVAVSSIDYRIDTKQANMLVKSVFRVLGLATQKGETSPDAKAAAHDLLMDGPLD